MLKDEEWLRQSFLVPTTALETQEEITRQFTEAEIKIGDTTLGGNRAINPHPQFTRFADIPVGTRHVANGTPGDFQQGMGRFYSEAFDDNGQFVHMRFGVPQHNSLTNFYLNFHNPQASILANRGRAPDDFYYAGRAGGAALHFVVTLPAQPFLWFNKLMRFATRKPASRYYYLKPAMSLYWSAVSTMVNQIGVNMGVISRGMTTGDDVLRGTWDKNRWEDEAGELRRIFAGLYPDIYRADGGIDIYAVATRFQRMDIRDRANIRRVQENSTTWSGLQSNMRRVMASRVKDPGMSNPDMNSYIKSYHSAAANQNVGDVSTDEIPSVESNGALNENLAGDPGYLEHAQAEYEDGASFITFKVNHQEDVSESFSNSVGESSVSSTLNGISSGARSARFTFADGNLDDSAIGKMVGGAVNSIKSVITGGLEGVGLTGLLALTGSAKVDIPKVWEDSDADLPKASYTINLRSPYGVPHARFQNLIVPLCMILAGVLPRATGKQSYTQPFICELYCKGRQQIRLGMIDSVSITRGVGNLGWTREGEPLGIDVTFTVADLSSVLHMPITSNFGVIDAAIEAGGAAIGATADAITGQDTGVSDGISAVASTLDMATYDDDNAFSDYLSVLGSLSLNDQIIPQNKARLRRSQRAAEWEQWKSKAFHTNWLMGQYPARVASSIIRAVDAPQLARSQ